MPVLGTIQDRHFIYKLDFQNTFWKIVSHFPAYLYVHFTYTRLTARVSRYKKGKTNLVFTEARDSEWLWHQLGHVQVCTSQQTDNHASTHQSVFLQAGCPSCRPTNSVQALKALYVHFT